MSQWKFLRRFVTLPSSTSNDCGELSRPYPPDESEGRDARLSVLPPDVRVAASDQLCVPACRARAELGRPLRRRAPRAPGRGAVRGCHDVAASLMADIRSLASARGQARGAGGARV